jgi:hypothetical protein
MSAPEGIVLGTCPTCGAYHGSWEPCPDVRALATDRGSDPERVLADVAAMCRRADCRRGADAATGECIHTRAGNALARLGREREAAAAVRVTARRANIFGPALFGPGVNGLRESEHERAPAAAAPDRVTEEEDVRGDVEWLNDAAKSLDIFANQTDDGTVAHIVTSEAREVRRIAASLASRRLTAERERDIAEATLRDAGYELIESNPFGERLWKPPVNEWATRAIAAERERDRLRAELRAQPHEWPCEHADGGAGACVDSLCPVSRGPGRERDA